MTTTFSHKGRTTDKSWLMSTSAIPISDRNARNTSRTFACPDTSSPETISPAARPTIAEQVYPAVQKMFFSE
jgi:hypothetical protein